MEAALRSHGVAFRVDRTQSIEHARELAREARGAGEIAAAMGGDGLAGAVAGELRGTDARDGGAARRPRQRLRAQARDRLRPGGGGRGADGAGGSGGSTSPRPASGSYPGHPQRRPGLRRAGHRQRHAAAPARAARLPLRHAARAAALAAGALGRDDRRDRAQRSAGTRSRSRTRASSAAGCGWCPTPTLDDGLLDVVFTARPAARPTYLRGLREGVQGHARRRARVRASARGREITFSADRPFTAYADGDPIADAARRPCACAPARCG